MVVDENGCIAEDEIVIQVLKNRDVFIPNAFSPNGDGVNDWLTVFGGRQVKEVHQFLVYSRWGEVVFEAYNFLPNDLSEGWNGRFKGDPMNPGVLVYWAEVEFIDGFRLFLKGDVTLMR